MALLFSSPRIWKHNPRQAEPPRPLCMQSRTAGNASAYLPCFFDGLEHRAAFPRRTTRQNGRMYKLDRPHWQGRERVRADYLSPPLSGWWSSASRRYAFRRSSSSTSGGTPARVKANVTLLAYSQPTVRRTDCLAGADGGMCSNPCATTHPRSDSTHHHPQPSPPCLRWPALAHCPALPRPQPAATSKVSAQSLL